MDKPDDLAFVLAGRMQRRKRRGGRGRWVGAGQNAAQNAAQYTSPAASPHRSPTQRAGDAGEDRALALLVARGLTLLARNLSCPLGEIDLVMRDGSTLVFVEVRARQHRQYGGAAASVGATKQQRLVHAARFFLPTLTRQHCQGVEPACRFDVVAFDDGAPVWLRGVIDA